MFDRSRLFLLCCCLGSLPDMSLAQTPSQTTDPASPAVPKSPTPETAIETTPETPEPVAASITPEGVLIGRENVYWNPRFGRYLTKLDLEHADWAADHNAPVLGPKPERATALYLNRLLAQGRAAGHKGVLYDNRDRGHSPLSMKRFPQMTPIHYSAALSARGLDYGLAEPLLFPLITLGNSSTAFTSGRYPRSLPRFAMTNPASVRRALQTYVSNHIYIYPEHRDHDATDRYPANWPYMLISQGSSGSDRPFLEAVALILAAFTPDTRAALVKTRLLAPTVQMVFRRAQTRVRSRAAYFSAAAHPTAFDKAAIAPTRMMALANSITPQDIPPLVALSVQNESFRVKAGLIKRSEKLFDTPAAIARVWRGWEWEKEMTLTAAATKDINGRDLEFRWVLLRGDPERVRIIPLDTNGQRARLVLNWQTPRQVSPEYPIISNRVDIGVFAYNGVHDSAPAFVSISFPDHQERRYEAGPDGTMRLMEINYDVRQSKAVFDPLLHWKARWRDQFNYDANGQLTGWQRLRSENPAPLLFGPDGELEDGQEVSYEIVDQGRLKMSLGPVAKQAP